MRIVYFGRYWCEYGGTDMDVRTILTRLSDRGHSCTSITYETDGSREKRKQRVEQRGVRTYHFARDVVRGLSFKAYKKMVLKALYAVVEREADVLLTIFPPQWEAWEIARHFGVPIINMFTLVADDYSGVRFNSDVSVFNSMSCRAAWGERGASGKYIVIYPPVDIKQEPDIYNYNGKIGMINPARHKGASVFDALARDLPMENFLACGGWSIGARGYRSKIRNQEYMDHVRDLRDFFKQIKVLLVPTQDDHFETYGRVVIEAMHYGVPVIASNKDGLPEAADGAAILVDEYSDIGAWKSSLEIMLQSLPDYHMRAVDRVRRYSIDWCIDAWERALGVLQ